MSLSAAAIRLMGAMGLTVDEIADVAEANAPDRTLSAGAERTRRWRERQAAASRCDVTETRHGDVSHVGERPQVVIPSLPSLRSEELGGGGGDAGERVSASPDDWPSGKASDHADLLIATVASPWLDPCKSPDLVTTRGRVAAWKRDGASWEHDVLPVVTGLCANRRARISSWKFFDQAVSRSIAENRAALEIPEAAGRRQTGPPSWVDQLSAVNAEARRRVLEAD